MRSFETKPCKYTQCYDLLLNGGLPQSKIFTFRRDDGASLSPLGTAKLLKTVEYYGPWCFLIFRRVASTDLRRAASVVPNPRPSTCASQWLRFRLRLRDSERGILLTVRGRHFILAEGIVKAQRDGTANPLPVLLVLGWNQSPCWRTCTALCRSLLSSPSLLTLWLLRACPYIRGVCIQHGRTGTQTEAAAVFGAERLRGLAFPAGHGQLNQPLQPAKSGDEVYEEVRDGTSTVEGIPMTISKVPTSQTQHELEMKRLGCMMISWGLTFSTVF